MCWFIVLLEDKHIASNAADHWQQFLHQRHFSVILSVDFSARFKANEVGITEFRYQQQRPYGLAENEMQQTAGSDIVLFGCYI